MDIILLLRIYLTSQINNFIFFLQKIPIVGGFIKESVFKRYGVKKSIAFLGIIYDLVRKILAKTVVVLLFVRYFPRAFFREELYTDFRIMFVFVILFVIYPFFRGSGVFLSGPQDQMFIHYFSVNPVSYYKYKGIKALVMGAVTFIPVLIFQFRKPFMVIALVLLKVAGNAFTNLVYLWFFSKFNRQPKKRLRRILGLGVIAGVYIACGFKLIPDVVIVEREYIVTSIVCIVIIIVSVIYMLTYKKYRELAIKYADRGIIVFSLGSGEDFNPDAVEIIDKGSDYHKAYFESHKSIEPETYIDRIFRKRYRKAIWDPVITSLIFYSIILGVFGLAVRLGWINISAQTLSLYSPILVTIAISASMVNAATQRYFRNVDLIYIKSRMITRSFLQSLMLKRYVRTLGMDIVITITIMVESSIFLLTSGIKYPIVDFAWLMASIVPILIIYDTYEWLMYYLVQPYSADLVAKSPVFSVMGYVTSIVMILLLFIRANMAKFFIPIIGITVLAMLIFYIASNYAYKTFKIRF